MCMQQVRISEKIENKKKIKGFFQTQSQNLYLRTKIKKIQVHITSNYMKNCDQFQLHFQLPHP